jgi:hypothetical protein
MVAILAIGYDKMKDLRHLSLPVTTQLLYLFDAHLDISLLARNPVDRQRGRPTGISLRRPRQYGIWMPYDNR